MSEDIHVFGLVAGTHLLEDIGMDVPHGKTVTIPAEKAGRSKDLWRAISQKLLFKVPGPNGAYLPQTHVAPPHAVKDDVLQSRVQFLEIRTKQLEDENAQLRAALQAAFSQKESLDAILAAIEGVKRTPVVVMGGQSLPAARAVEELADGAAPQFIPEQIAPKDASTRIDLVKQESTAPELSDAATRLRKLRRGSGDG